MLSAKSRTPAKWIDPAMKLFILQRLANNHESDPVSM